MPEISWKAVAWLMTVALVLALIAILLLVVHPLAAVPKDRATENGAVLCAMDIQEKLSRALGQVDEAVALSSSRVVLAGLSGDEAAGVLTDLQLQSGYGINPVIFTSDFRVTAISPGAPGSPPVGTLLNRGPMTEPLLSRGRPILSPACSATEGIPHVVAVGYPVPGRNATPDGAVTILLQPVTFFPAVLSPLVNRTPYAFFVMQTDGTLVYDTDTSGIGHNTFSDPRYAVSPSRSTLVARVCAEPSGTGRYDVGTIATNTTLRKGAAWTTVSLHGNEWRVVVIWPVT